MSCLRKCLPALLLLAATTTACSGERELREPSLNKDDVADSVSIQGSLAFGESATSEITSDFEFHGYLFRARAGAEVSVELTQLGSSAGFDTSLFVYQPGTGATAWDASALAQDDDSGFGKLSEINGLVLGEQQTYLAVVGTPLGTGRGRYRIELRCDDGDCSPIDDGPACPAELEEFIRDCMSEEMFEQELTEAEAFDACTDTPFAGFGDEPEEVFAELCEFGSTPDWCLSGVEDFVLNKIPACIDALAPEFEPSNVSLSHLVLDPSINNFLSCEGETCDFLSIHPWAHTYDPAGASAIELSRAVRDEWLRDLDVPGEEFEELTVSGALSKEALDSELSFVGLERAGLEALIGSDYGYSKVSYAWNCAPSVECSGSLNIINLADQQELIVFDISGGDE